MFLEQDAKSGATLEQGPAVRERNAEETPARTPDPGSARHFPPRVYECPAPSSVPWRTLVSHVAAGPAVPSQISCVSAELCRLDLSVEGTHVWKTEVGGVCAQGEA